MTTTSSALPISAAPEALRGALRGCDVDLVFLEKVGPSTTLDSWCDGDSVIFQGSFDSAFKGRLRLPPDRCLIGHVKHTSNLSWCHGHPLTSGSLFTVLPGSTSDFMLAAGTQVTVAMITASRFQIATLKLTGFTAFPPQFAGTLSHGKESAATNALGSTWRQLAEQTGEDTASMSTEKAQLEGLLEAHLRLALLTDHATALPHQEKIAIHYAVFRRAERHMRDRMRQAIYVGDLCRDAGVCERTLRYAFDDMVGISPSQYLLMLRLCTAHAQLSVASPDRTSVQSVAMNCGLWDLSRFAENFRLIFGENPRQTLKRSPTGNRIHGNRRKLTSAL